MIRSVYQVKDDSRDVLAQMLDLFRVNYGISIVEIAKEIEVKPWVLYDARRVKEKGRGRERAEYLLFAIKEHYPEQYKTISRRIIDMSFKDCGLDAEGPKHEL